MVLALRTILMLSDKLVFVWELQHYGKELQQLYDNEFMALPAEAFDLCNMLLQHSRLLSRMVAVKLRDIVDLRLVSESLRQPTRYQ